MNEDDFFQCWFQVPFVLHAPHAPQRGLPLAVESEAMPAALWDAMRIEAVAQLVRLKAHGDTYL